MLQLVVVSEQRKEGRKKKFFGSSSKGKMCFKEKRDLIYICRLNASCASTWWRVPSEHTVLAKGMAFTLWSNLMHIQENAFRSIEKDWLICC